MNLHFPRMLSLLRKERKLSQKQVAMDLDISQALLSHYEKGIRECGLEFVVKVADYYNVSCDYLLGRSADRSGSTLTAEELPESAEITNEKAQSSIALQVLLSKKLITNSIYVVFDLLAKTKNKWLVSQISSFLMLSVYRCFRIIFNSDKNNKQELFALPKPLASGYCSATCQRLEAEMLAATRGKTKNIAGLENIGEILPVSISSQSLTSDYPLFAPSLLNLIKNAEKEMIP